MADQCIICLESLDPASPDEALSAAVAVPAATALTPADTTKLLPPAAPTDEPLIACINPCGHVLHDECLRAWIQKANSCPICRQAFNLVEVSDTVGGVKRSEYHVADKKQVADFDPTAWMEEHVEEEEEATPCPICGQADQEEVLLLCDACDAPYHTHCIGLDDIPRGRWFCMECEAGTSPLASDPNRRRRHPRTFNQRTQAQIRRAARRGRSDEWQDAWSLIANRVWDALNLDLDSLDDDDSLSEYREHQRTVERQRREFQLWQQRINIAGRQGARDAFRLAARPMLQREEPPPPRESEEELRAWNDFEMAQQLDTESPNSRKRKRSRSVTASPAEPPPREPERKLKRPRRRRVLEQPEPAEVVAESSRQNGVTSPGATPSRRPSRPLPAPENAPPSFLASLLREVEMAPSALDDEATRGFFHLATAAGSPSVEHSSPAASPSSSNFPTPRAMSSTPPPHSTKTPGSPLPLTSHVMPAYHHVDYSPNRTAASPEASPDKAEPSHAPSPTLELRHPRPQHRTSERPARDETSPSRPDLSFEAKEGINKIVKKALEPHWKADGKSITKDQYATINRDVSRMLYDRIQNPYALDDSSISAWEKIAQAAVTKAVDGLTA